MKINKKVTIETDNLFKILMKNRGPNERCKICISGLCIVCQAWATVKESLSNDEFEYLESVFRDA